MEKVDQMNLVLLIPRMLRLAVLFAFFVLSQTCIANDGIGMVSAGGIEFKKTNNISMEKEVLSISVEKIRIDYEFLNTTDSPIRETVLFPMPLYRFDYGVSPAYSGELQNFKVWINGVQFAPSHKVVAKLDNGRDVTEILKNSGLKDNDISEYRGIEQDDTGGLHPKGAVARNMKQLIKDGLLDEYFFPQWTVTHIYYWEMTFPPHNTIHVSHEYRPFTGKVAMGFELTSDKNDDSPSQYENSVKVSGNESYCMTEGTVRAIQQTQKEISKPFVTQEVGYILSTGANWAGPIKSFTLNLRKRHKHEFVSVCFDGKFKKTDELTLSATLKDFVRQNELNILFLMPWDDRYYGFPYDLGLPEQHY